MKLKRRIKKPRKMKKIKFYLILIILIWCLRLKLQETSYPFNKQDDKDKGNVLIHSSGTNSVTIQWLRLWGERGGIGGKGVAVDSSDNVYIIGHRGHYRVDNIYENFLVKYDSSGVQLWNRTWEGSWMDEKGGVAVDSTDNVYVAGCTFSLGSAYMILMKYDSSGVLQWNRTWGGIEWDEGRGVVVDSSDSVYLAGCTSNFGEGNRDIVLVKYDSSGVQQWNRTWGGINDDEGNGVVVDSSDNVYLAGTTFSFGAGENDIVLVKYDSSGVQHWNRTWGGSSRDEGNGVVVDSSDNVCLAGTTYNFGEGSSEMVLMKYDSSGVQQWNRTWGGHFDDEGYGVAVDSFDNVYLAGNTDSFGHDILLAKYNSSGEWQWYHAIGGSEGEECSGVVVDSSDNVYISGAMLWGRTVLVKFIISNITIIFPNQLNFFGSVSPSFEISTFDSNLDSTWYSLDNGKVNFTFFGSIGTINQTEWDKEGDGLVDIRFYMNNTLGKEEFVEVSVIKDTHKPKITIDSPLQNEKYGYQAPSYMISIVEPNFAYLWIEINDQHTSLTIVPDNISQVSATISGWDDLPQGEINITFYAGDITGKIGSASVVVIKSIPPPTNYYPLILFISISFFGVAVFIIVKNRIMSKKNREELDSL